MKEVKQVYEPNCSDGWSTPVSEINGECPECGTPTVDGHAAHGCGWSEEKCETCGRAFCDWSC